jgi:outer membrane protein assembly factor BamB
VNHPLFRSTPALAALALLPLTAPIGAQDDGNWPAFRGHRARGVAEGYALPESWDVPTGEGVRWKTPIPGLAHSSPIVWGDRVYVTTAVRAEGEAKLESLYGSPNYGAGESIGAEGAHEFRLYALDRETGEVVWERTAHTGPPAVERHPKSSHANPTPVCDARRVLAFFGSEGLYAYDHDGELLWKRDLGTLDSGAPGQADLQWGFASSPVLHGERVIVQCDVQDQSFLLVLDAATGEDVWRTDRDEDPTWSTPTVHERAADGKAQIICNGYKHIGGYDLETGEELWKLVGGGDVPVPTPIVEHELIFITNAHGRMAPMYAIDVEAEGLLTIDPDDGEHMAWSHPRRGIYMQTPIVYGEELYACSDGGILTSFDAGTGEILYRERLGDGLTGFSGSAVGGDGKLYFSGESGQVYVVLPGYDFEVLAVNDLGETCMATPAVSRGTLFFRTRNHLVAVGGEASR